MADRDRLDATLEPDVRLTLLGSFGLTVGGREVPLPPSAQRVLAALALARAHLDRTLLGALLYPDGRRNQASASLRSALWRTKSAAGRAVVEAQGQRLRLMVGVEVDVQRWARQARSVASEPSHDAGPDSSEMVEALSQELLPSWPDEWLILERQRWDHLRLHALEILADKFAADGRHMDAVEAGHAAVAIEPYRESAHRTLIRAYIAEGNCASALAQYQRCQRVLMRDLGVQPTAQIRALVKNITVD
ncbi:MAG TPA: BTAD domain-containing putative transcriptional regulator [Mycobacteriales bacterium]